MPKSNIFIRKRYLNLKSYKSASGSLLIIVSIYDRNNINVFTIIDCHSCALQRLVLFNKCMHAPCCLLSPQALFKIDDKNLTFPAAFPKLTIPSFWPDIIVTRLYTFHFFWSQFVCRVQNNVCLSHRHHSPFQLLLSQIYHVQKKRAIPPMSCLQYTVSAGGQRLCLPSTRDKLR